MEIIYEDDEIIVVNKPAGVVVNRSDTQKGKETVQDWVESHVKFLPDALQHEEFLSRSGIVHRLDKDTSGLMVIAKNPEAFLKIKQQFMDRQIKKGYLVLVHGEVKEQEGIIEKPIGRNPKNRMRFDILDDGRPAVTKYRKVEDIAFERVAEFSVRGGGFPSAERGYRSNASSTFTLIEAEPLTGRTHQIRVHLKSIGHPVVGDELYLSKRQIKIDRQIAPRQFLHAFRLGFVHPQNGERLLFETDLPEDLEKVLEKLEP